jgi:hypothetical protein
VHPAKASISPSGKINSGCEPRIALGSMFKKGDSDLPLEPSPKEPLSGPFRPPLSPDACAYMPNDSARTTCWPKAGRNGPGFGENGLGFGGEGRYPENVFTEKGACLLVSKFQARCYNSSSTIRQQNAATSRKPRQTSSHGLNLNGLRLRSPNSKHVWKTNTSRVF